MKNAPGLQIRKRKGEPAYYWIARAVVRNTQGFEPETVRLESDDDRYPVGDERRDRSTERALRCRQLAGELHIWIAERDAGKEGEFNGTIKSVVRCYQRDEDSPYREVKHSTRADYDHLLGIIERGVGDELVSTLTRSHFARWYREARAPAKAGGAERLRRAHGCMKVLRIIMNYGKSMRYEGCRDCAEILAEMRFELPASRREAVTFDQAAAIVDQALRQGAVSIALAQALQFECSLRQIDVIGEWSPASAEGGGIVHREARWGGGILWSDVSADLVAVKKTTKTGATGEWDLTRCPLVMKVLQHVPSSERLGPMIVSEKTARPYRANHFQKEWRAIARVVGVPDTVWNRDSRAGGITEGDQAGAEPRDLQKLATHASFQTTSRYIRSTTIKSTNKVADLRSAARKKER